MTDEKQSTRYVILRRNGRGGWEEIGEASAGNALTAIKKMVGDGTNVIEDSAYRAVPTRSWHDPIIVRAVPQTVLKFETDSRETPVTF
jgi:hypothetical protein